jgi:hypothetical protein
MKKIFFFTSLLLLSSWLRAQQPFEAHVNFGIKADLNLASLSSSDDVITYKYKPSFNAGILAHIHFSHHFAVQPELIYSGQGAKYSLAGDDINICLGYLNMPILLQYMFGDGFRLETGPQVGLLLSAKSKIGDNSTDIKDNTNDGDFSWAFGISYVSEPGLGVDVRYNLGINNVSTDGETKLRNSVFAIGLFYQIKGKYE